MSNRHHLLISGTGRSGTSFLVKYLSGLGMQTHIENSSNDFSWDDQANAGLENFLLEENPPYVVKTPWLHNYIDMVINKRCITIDAVILPIRNLAESSFSRSVIELRHVHQIMPQMAEEAMTWETWGSTPGGTVYSLNPLDQGRLLAVGFHQLVERLVAARIPMYFLSFPRLVQDSQYLFETLREILPKETTPERATAVFTSIADLSKVRAGTEVAQTKRSHQKALSSVQYPPFSTLDQAALRRELLRVRQSVAETSAEAERARAETVAAVAEAERARAETAAAVEEAERARAETLAAVAEAKKAGDKAAAANMDALTALKERDAMLASSSWKITSPARLLATYVRQLHKKRGGRILITGLLQDRRIERLRARATDHRGP